MSAVAPTAPATAAPLDRLAVVCLGQLMIVLDGSIVNVALPAIQRDLHFRQADLTWVINAYLITFGSFLLVAGRLGDLVGRRRVFLAGVVLFTLASAVCGSPTTRRADRRALRAGDRRRGRVLGDHRADRHRVPRARASARRR